MIDLLASLDFGQLLTAGIVLLVMGIMLWANRSGKNPMAADNRAWLHKFIETNHDRYVTILVTGIFMWAALHVSHENPNSPLLETFKTLLAGAAGWLGNMLNNRQVARTADKPELQPGVQGTQETETNVRTLTKQAVPATPVVPTEPIEVKVVDEPVRVVEEKNPNA